MKRLLANVRSAVDDDPAAAQRHVALAGSDPKASDAIQRNAQASANAAQACAAAPAG